MYKNRYNSIVLDCFELPYIVIDKNMSEVRSNQAWTDLCNTYLSNGNFYSFLSSSEIENQNRFNSFLDSYFQRKSTEVGEFFFSSKTKDRNYYFRIKTCPLKADDTEDEVLLLLVFHESLSLFSSKLESSINSERMLRVIHESTQAAILIVDCDENIVYANPSFYQLNMSYALEENQLVPLKDIYPQKTVRPMFKKALSKGEKSFFDADVVNASGEVLKQSFRIFPLRVGERTKAAFAFIYDKTKTRTSENQFLNNYKMTILGNLAGGITHELNTPLGVVRLSAEMLISALEAGEENHDIFIKYLNQIVNSTDKMTNIVKQVSRFSRNDDLGKKLYCDINELIQNVVVMYGKLFKTDDISLEMKLGKNIPLLYLDPSQIQTVITDLINNARDILTPLEFSSES